MKMVPKAQNLIEWIALKANLYPLPMGDAQCMLTLSKAISVAFKLDIFETVKDSSQTIEQIAQKTKLHPRGLRSLMNILTSIGYFKYKDGKFGLTKVSKKWCLKDSRDSVYNHNRYIDIYFIEVTINGDTGSIFRPTPFFVTQRKVKK